MDPMSHGTQPILSTPQKSSMLLSLSASLASHRPWEVKSRRPQQAVRGAAYIWRVFSSSQPMGSTGNTWTVTGVRGGGRGQACGTEPFS